MGFRSGSCGEIYGVNNRDGIVSQIGSLLMAMSAGVIVTRVFDGSDDNVAVGIFKELMQNSVVVYTLAAMFILMGVFSPLPTIPFVGIGVVLGIIGYRTQFNLKKKSNWNLKKKWSLSSRKPALLKRNTIKHLAQHEKNSL